MTNDHTIINLKLLLENLNKRLEGYNAAKKEADDQLLECFIAGRIEELSFLIDSFERLGRYYKGESKEDVLRKSFFN